MPTVSVIIPSYNHEEYVGECVQSVLDQTFQDFEIVVTDDGSSDQTVAILERFADPRLKLFKHPKNQGASIAANNCLRHSSGRYIAMLSSDDAWYPDKLAVQVRYLEAHPEVAVVFGKVEWVDETGKSISPARYPAGDVFDVENRTRFEWLNHFFRKGNCLCHPSSLVRRECYAEVGLFNPAFAGLPDFDFWVRICLKYEIVILDQKLIRLRRLVDKKNASGDVRESRKRNRFEHKQILDHYLTITDLKGLLAIFPEAVKYGELTADLIPFYLGQLALESDLDFKVLWGLETIYRLMRDETAAQALQDKHHFTYADFARLTSKYDPFNSWLSYQLGRYFRFLPYLNARAGRIPFVLRSFFMAVIDRLAPAEHQDS